MQLKNLLLLLLFSAADSFGQTVIEKQRSQIVAEGKKLYASEMASWYGMDLFLEKRPNTDDVGGYFSYVSDNKTATCIFFSNKDNPKVIGTIVFDETFNVHTANYNLLEREFTKDERAYYDIRKKTIERIEKDPVFEYFKDTNLNIVPLISGKEKKVYVLTGASGNNHVVIYGNDYLLNFDSDDNIASVKKLHAYYIPLEYGKKDIVIESAMHTHIASSSELMTPTDICTTMLYEKLTGWKTAMVFSKEFVSIWDCVKDDLTVMTVEVWEKITEVVEEEK